MVKDEMIKKAISLLDIDKEYKENLIVYYDRLINDSIFLTCLINAGVDNWDGYKDVQESLESEE